MEQIYRVKGDFDTAICLWHNKHPYKNVLHKHLERTCSEKEQGEIEMMVKIWTSLIKKHPNNTILRLGFKEVVSQVLQSIGIYDDVIGVLVRLGCERSYGLLVK